MIYRNITFKAEPFSYNFEFEDRITLIGGDSGSGKTLFCEKLREQMISNVKVFNYESVNFEKTLSECENCLVVIDNAACLVTEEVKKLINFNRSNQYVLMLQNCDGLNVSDKSFKLLRCVGDTITLVDECDTELGAINAF